MMKMKFVLKAVFIAAVGISSVQAADLSSAVLSPGDYRALVMPEFNADMAANIKAKMKDIEGLTSVEAKSSDASIHFTVKDGSRVKVDQLQKVLAKVDSGAVMATPILEKSMSTNPGL